MKIGINTPPIAYLAPEIPGSSSTFVYNEIIEVEKLGINVHPFSLHSVNTKSEDPGILAIAKKCEYLYRLPITSLLAANFVEFFRSPFRYFKSLTSCLFDVARCIGRPRIAAGLLYRFLVAGYLAQRLLKEGVAHLHCHFSHIAADVGMYAALQSGIPFSFTAHANDIFERGYLLKEKGRRAKFVATISSFNIELLKSNGIPENKLKLVRCGVDTEKFTPRKRVHHNKKLKVIGFLGRLVEKKGVDLLIDAMRIMIDRGEQVRLEIMGDGPMDAVLRKQVEQQGLAQYISFGGALSHDEVSKWFEKIDLFTFPGKVDSNGDMDGIPVVLMEAMMRGVPVIATSVSGIPELVREKETGFIARPDPVALADKIIVATTETKEQVAQKIQNAINLVATEFNLSRNTKMLTQHIYAVV